MLTNCKNCGAPLKDYKCPYCGTEYEYIPSLNDFRQVVKINIMGMVRHFYIEEICCEPTYTEATRLYDETLNIIQGEPSIEISLKSYN